MRSNRTNRHPRASIAMVLAAAVTALGLLVPRAARSQEAAVPPLLPSPAPLIAASSNAVSADEARALLARIPDRETRRVLAEGLRSGEMGMAELLRRVGQLSPVAAQAVSSKPLGPQLDRASQSTTFRLFAPRASSVVLHLYTTATGGTADDYVMRRDGEGVWEVTVTGLRIGVYYTYSVAGPAGPGNFFDATHEVSDPYALANVGAAGRSLVIDPTYHWHSTGWKSIDPTDLIVYEMHVRGFTEDPSSAVPEAHRGRYLGLLDGDGTPKVLGHLKELGVTAVELMPIHEYDPHAAPPQHINYWGYMTSHFFAPTVLYASGAEHAESVTELKAAIDGLHQAGLAVILDVVYNHTCEGNERGPVYNFKGIDAPYYYRLTPDLLGFLNGTGCGNEFRSESPMTRRLILDSLTYWVRDYHVDGFRFDLAPELDKDTILAINERLGDKVLIAEPWSADWNRRQWDRQELRGTHWAFWNDQFREPCWAFLNGQAKRDDLMSAMAGSCMSFAARPQQSVNYLESHDNATLADRVGHDPARLRLGAMLNMVGQGIPMIHNGQEIGKDKKGNDNSYDQDNAINWIDWSLKDKNHALFEYYQGLIAIRSAHRALRYGQCLTDQTVRWFRPDNDRALGFLLRGGGAGGPGGGGPASEGDVLVLLNSDPSATVAFDLPTSAAWTVLANDTQAHNDGRLGTAQGNYKVPPVSGAILVGKGNW